MYFMTKSSQIAKAVVPKPTSTWESLQRSFHPQIYWIGISEVGPQKCICRTLGDSDKHIFWISMFKTTELYVYILSPWMSYFYKGCFSLSSFLDFIFVFILFCFNHLLENISNTHIVEQIVNIFVPLNDDQFIVSLFFICTAIPSCYF